MVSRKEIYRKIQSAFWDYNVDPADIYLILLDKKEGTGFFSKEKILVRLLERLSWYEIVDILSEKYLAKNLKISILSKIRNSAIRNKYEFIGRILRGETLSDSGWSIQNRERLKSSVLSHRWHGS